MKYILGISAFFHDSAVALIRDGKIISAVQEERFTRIKHDAAFPKNALIYILREAKLNLDEIDKVVFFEKPFLKFERLVETYVWRGDACRLVKKGYRAARLQNTEIKGHRNTKWQGFRAMGLQSSRPVGLQGLVYTIYCLWQ